MPVITDEKSVVTGFFVSKRQLVCVYENKKKCVKKRTNSESRVACCRRRWKRGQIMSLFSTLLADGGYASYSLGSLTNNGRKNGVTT